MAVDRPVLGSPGPKSRTDEGPSNPIASNTDGDSVRRRSIVLAGRAVDGVELLFRAKDSSATSKRV